MIKRTLVFSNPAYLSTRNKQLVIAFPENTKPEVNVPIEDIGFLVLEHPQITITNKLIEALVQNKVAVLTCDAQHLPCGFLQPLVGHSEQTQRYRHQLEASMPLKKNLWQQTISVKIENQAKHLKKRENSYKTLLRWSKEVKSGDNTNLEGVAASYYFQRIYPIESFSRYRNGLPPNNLLNYGYAILRAIAARAIVSSGMLPSIGIFHSNKYNAFCLADDIMEPYRPFVDSLVYDMITQYEDIENLNTELKVQLLKIPVLDVEIDGKNSPLMHAMSRTTNSLYECFEGTSRKILYPVLN